jgi:hypothetical protein
MTRAVADQARASRSARKVLAALASLSPDVSAFREPQIGDSAVDAVVEVDNVPVTVGVTFARTPMVVRARVRSVVQRRGDKTLNPLVFVSRFPSPFAAEEEAEMRIVVAQWNSPDDDNRLLGALRRAGAL